MTQSNRRRQMDFAKLASQERFVVHSNDSIHEFWVEFRGPSGTPYEGGFWTLHVLLPAEYPFKSPSIGFANRIFHPNIDEASGSVCLDVINQTWTPLYELTNVFDTFFPQLMRYPNPTDPLNPEAAALQLRDPVAYATRVQEHVRRFASPQEARLGLQKSGVTELNPRSELCRIATAPPPPPPPFLAPCAQKLGTVDGSTSPTPVSSNGLSPAQPPRSQSLPPAQQNAPQDDYEPEEIDI